MSTDAPEAAKQADAERKAVVWSVLNALGTKGTSLAIYLLLARLLGPEVFGVVALGLAATTLLEALCEHKLGSILIQRPQVGNAELNSVFAFQTGLGILCAAGLAMSAGVLAALLSEPRLAFVLPWLALAMVFNVATFVHDALLRRDLRFRALTLRNLAANVLGGAVGIALAFLGAGLWSMVAMVLTSAVTGAIVIWGAARWRPTGRFAADAFMPLYRDARHVAWPNILGSLAQQANMFIVGHFFGAAVAGHYAFALRIYDVVMRITTFSFSEAAFPILAKRTDDPALYREGFLGLISSTGCLTVGLLMVAAGIVPAAVPLVFGANWAPASDYLVVYLVGGALISMGAYNDVTLMAFAETRKLASTFYASIALWLLQLPLLPHVGPLFPAVAWFVKEMFIFPPKSLWSLRLMGLPVQTYLRLTLSVLAAGVLALVVVSSVRWWLGTATYFGLAACGLVGLAVFCGAAAALGVTGARSALARLSLLLGTR
ncbi:oligosaccharide flippase family protein [Burkholderiaceae bacterium UC74_6]